MGTLRQSPGNAGKVIGTSRQWKTRLQALQTHGTMEGMRVIARRQFIALQAGHGHGI